MKSKIESLILPAYRIVMTRVAERNYNDMIKGYMFTEEDKSLIGQYYNKALYISNVKLPPGASILNNKDLNFKQIQEVSSL